jgi:deoxyribodipyrimidine photolyase
MLRCGNTDIDIDIFRKYVPALSAVPEKYIHEPWTAPYDVQEKAKCIIGAEYPDRMIDHIEARQRCVEKMRKFHKELVHPSKLIMSCLIQHCKS